MAQMQTISIRIPDADFHWLLARQEPGASTPSEKLRALLAGVRQQESGLTDPDACAAWLRGLEQPFSDAVASLERKQDKHSDLIGTVAELLPQIMATLISSRPDDEQAARAIEATLARQCYRLFAALLRTAVTSTPSAYDKNAHTPYLTDIIELANIISTTQGKEPNHG